MASDEPRVVRFGVAMDPTLLVELDAVVRARESTRSEVLRDLVRAEVAKKRLDAGVEAIAALTLVYDHHVRDLADRLTDIQHDMGDRVRSTMHVHLDHHLCLEVIVVRGKSDELETFAGRILATKGVLQGGIEIFAVAEHDGSHHHGLHASARR
jgi:CopG family nickel-responsive transcriptional regulator